MPTWKGSEPVNVLYCILDNRFGGPHRRSSGIARQLKEHGIETIFLLGQRTGEAPPMAGFRCLPIKHMQCIRREAVVYYLLAYMGFFPYNVAKVRRAITAHAIDVVHVDGSMNIIPALAAALHGTPIVWHYNDNMPRGLRRVFVPLIASLADRIIVQGRCFEQHFGVLRPERRDKLTVIYPAVDTTAFGRDTVNAGRREQLRAELGVPPGSVLIGTIGNINHFKGHRYLLEAVPTITDKLKSVKFLIVGSVSNAACRDELQGLVATLGVGRDVIFAGFRDDIPAVLSALDVFVLPSIRESCPNVVLEAMAMRVPVVATTVGAVSEQIVDGRTGILVPPGHPRAIADAVLTCLRRPQGERTAMVDAARARVEEMFSLGRAAEQQEHVYRQVLALRRGQLCP